MCIFLLGIPSTSHLRVVTDAEASDGSENASLSPTSKKLRSESTWRPPGIDNTLADVKPVSPSQQSTSMKSSSQTTEMSHAVADKPLEQINSCAFAPSARSLRSSSSQRSSPELAATEDITNASQSVSASASPESHQPSSALSPRTAVQVLRDAANEAGTKSSVKGGPTMISPSSVGGEWPRSEISSRKSSPGGVMQDRIDSVLRRDAGSNQQPSSVPFSSFDSPLSSRSDPGHGTTLSAGTKLSGNLDSDPSIKKNVGRGQKLMALLKSSSAAAAEYGARASRSSPELTDSNSRSSLEHGTVPHTREGPWSKYFEQLPEQMPISVGLDEEFESSMDPVIQTSSRGAECQHFGQVTGEEASLSKSAIPCSHLEVTGSASVLTSRTEDKATALPIPSSQSSLSPVPVHQENLYGEALSGPVSRMMPTMSDQTGSLERSLGSSSDVSKLSSEGLDQSSSSRMLTKRLPKVASKSGSRTGTPVPLTAQASVSGRPSFSPSPVHSATASRVASPAMASTEGNESYDCIPEGRRDTVTSHAANVPAFSRFMHNLLIITFS